MSLVHGADRSQRMAWVGFVHGVDRVSRGVLRDREQSRSALLAHLSLARVRLTSSWSELKTHVVCEWGYNIACSSVTSVHFYKSGGKVCWSLPMMSTPVSFINRNTYDHGSVT